MARGGMTRAEWVRIAALLAAAYPRQQVPQATWDLYGRELAVYPAAAVEAAVRAAIREREWLPSLADLLGRLRAAETPALTPEAAWEEIQQALVRYGPYQPHPPWSHPAVAAAVQAVGGLLALAEMDYDALSVARAHVYRHVAAALARERAAAEAGPIRAALGLPPAAGPGQPALPTARAAPPPPTTPPDPAVLEGIRRLLDQLGKGPQGPKGGSADAAGCADVQ